MSGYQTYTRFQRIEARAELLGFRIGNSKHGAWGSGDDRIDVVAIYPKDNALPTYSRDAELFCGTFTQLENFLMGWEKAQQYDMLLRLTDEKKRKRAEEKTRERIALLALKEEQKKVWDTLKEKDNG
jgi:hypothetical protein